MNTQQQGVELALWQKLENETLANIIPKNGLQGKKGMYECLEN